MLEEVQEHIYKIGYFRVRVKWNALQYYAIAGLYRTHQEVEDRLDMLRKHDPAKWDGVHFNVSGIYIDNGVRHIAQYNSQSDAYVGRDILKPILTLPMFDKVYYTDDV